MKKWLFIVILEFVCVFGLFAQSGIDIWEVADETTNVLGFNAFSKSDCYDTLDAPHIYDDNKNQYAHNWDGWHVIRIDFTNTLSPNQNSLLHFPIIVWTDVSENNFVYDLEGNNQYSDLIRGFSVDFSDPSSRYVECKVQTNSDVKLGVVLTDIQGKQSNGAIPIVSINSTAGGANIADASKWQTITFNWSGDATSTANVPYLIDTASTEWWGRSNVGYRNAVEKLDSTRIVMLSFIIDPQDLGNLNDEKTVYIKDIQVGDGFMQFSPDCINSIVSNFKNAVKINISFQDNKLQIVNQKEIASFAVIDINGKEVLSNQIQPQESISIESLPKGVYVIKVETENKITEFKIVK